VKTALKGERIQKILRFADKWAPVIYFCYVFCMYFALTHTPYFTDEQDIYYGGYAILKGQGLYTAYISQHMPFSYYFAVIPALLGARSVFQFRLVFYVMLSGLWTAAYVRHRRSLRQTMLILTPLAFLAMLRLYSMGTALLSDHWQGIGYILIFWELIRYREEGRISAAGSVMISIGIMLSLGTAFISAYTVLIFFLGAAAVTIVHLCKADREGRRGLIRDLCRLVLICAAPFLILAGIYLLKGKLGDAIEGAYTMNREVYSQYISGYGSDATGIIGDTIRAHWEYIVEALNELTTDPVESWVCLLQTVCLLICAVIEGRKNPAVGLTILAATVFAGIRGRWNFHAMAYTAMAGAEIAYCAGELSAWTAKWKKPHLAQAVRIVMALSAGAVIAPFVVYFGYNILSPRMLSRPVPDALDEHMITVTEENEKVHACGTSVISLNMMYSERVPDDLSLGITTPWFWEVYGERELAWLKENQTRVMIFNVNDTIWNHVTREYASEFVAYVEKNYTNIGLADDLMIRNEYVPEALEKLEAAGVGVIGTVIEQSMGEDGTIELATGDTLSQRFVAAGSELTGVYVRFGTHQNRMEIWATVEVADPESGEIIASGTLEPERIADNFFTRCAMTGTLETGKEYEARVTIEKLSVTWTRSELKGTMFLTPEGTATETEYAVYQGKKLNQCMPLKVEYGRMGDTNDPVIE